MSTVCFSLGNYGEGQDGLLEKVIALPFLSYLHSLHSPVFLCMRKGATSTCRNIRDTLLGHRWYWVHAVSYSQGKLFYKQFLPPQKLLTSCSCRSICNN